MFSSYDLEPVVELTHWSVYEVPLYGEDAPWTRHFVGFADELRQGQVSSAIVMFDQEHAVGASASHRVFQLVGESGQHLEATKLWARWKTLNGVHQDRDITATFFRARMASQHTEVVA